MQRTSFIDMPCSVARTLDIIGEWWTLLILRDIFYGVRRFESLRQHLGISRKILTSRLQRLVDEGILRKAIYQRSPARYEYRLSAKGNDLLPVLLSIMKWGDRWASESGKAPVVFVHTDCGEETTPVLVCSHCGGELTARNVLATAGPGAPKEEIERLRKYSVYHDLFPET